MKLTALTAFAGTALAFADTAAFFSSQEIDAANPQYITKSTDLSTAFNRFTAEFCSKSPAEKLLVYRVENLDRKAPAGADSESTFFKHVHYSSGSDIDLSVADACSVVYVDRLPNNYEETTANIIVVDVDGSQVHSIDDFLTGSHVVVQGKPAFQTAGSRGESIKEFLGEKLNLDFSAHAKRDSVDSDDYEFLASLRDEIDNEFEAAEALIIAQESDSTVTALSDDLSRKELSGSSKNGTSTKSNLFTNYQFFTPGVWSVLIVCFFLVYVCITAVSWITSIDLSYKSFEKQIEYEKKNE